MLDTTTSRADRHAPFMFGLIVTALVLAFVLAGAHELAQIVGQVNVALGGAR